MSSQRKNFRNRLRLLALPVVLSLVSCTSKPPDIAKINLDPNDACSEAFKLYDTDGNGAISTEEAKKFVSLNTVFKEVDKDGNGAVTKEELTARFQEWVDSPARLVSAAVHVTMDGQRLPFAKVKLVPEPFLKGIIYSASGETKTAGIAVMKLGDDAPAGEKGIRSVHLGFYRVEITHSEKDIPAVFNTETTLGCEVTAATDDRGLKFDLKTR